LNAGGSGGIKAQLEMQGSMVEYAGIIEEKTLSIFDSDRDSSDFVKRDKYNMLEFLKGRKFDIQDSVEWSYQVHDRFLWHMWYKRELENYVPLATLYDAYPEIDALVQKQISDSDEEAQDFFKFGTILAKGYKNTAPELFLKIGITEKLQTKCAHHTVKIELPNGTLTDVTEIEKVLLMIARII